MMSERSVVIDDIEGEEPFQRRVDTWIVDCFGPSSAADKTERTHRFLEEALELAQSAGCTRVEANQLVDYVFGRHAGGLTQEVGGVMLTLAGLCNVHFIDLTEAGEAELRRVWTKIHVIRSKQATKPKHSPLPGISAEQAAMRSETRSSDFIPLVVSRNRHLSEETVYRRLMAVGMSFAGLCAYFEVEFFQPWESQPQDHMQSGAR